MRRLERFYTAFEDAAAGVFFFSGIALVFYGVFFRYVLKSPIFWVDEISTYILVWGCVLGWSIAQREGRHIKVSLLYDRLPPKVQWVISIFSNSVSIVFCLFLAYLGFLLEAKYLKTGQLSLNTQFPLWIVYFFVPIAALMLAIQFTRELYHVIKQGPKTSSKARLYEYEQIMKGVSSQDGDSSAL